MTEPRSAAVWDDAADTYREIDTRWREARDRFDALALERNKVEERAIAAEADLRQLTARQAQELVLAQQAVDDRHHELEALSAHVAAAQAEVAHLATERAQAAGQITTLLQG